MIQFSCGTCGKPVFRYKGNTQNNHFCDRDCWAINNTSKPKNTYWCPKCETQQPADNWAWAIGTRTRGGKIWEGPIREGYCKICQPKVNKTYHDNPDNKIRATEQHAQWRKQCASQEGDALVRWWFARGIGSYRKRARDKNIPFDLTVDGLVELYYKQQGRCHYTNEIMDINTQGTGHQCSKLKSMSLDRQVPALGYVFSNVVLCLYSINTMKSTLLLTEFYDICKLMLSVKKDGV